MKVGLYNPVTLGTHHDDIIAAVVNSHVDILAVNETWLRPNEEAKAPIISEYNLRSAPRPPCIGGGRGGGVAFYIRKDLNACVCQHSICQDTSY